MQRNHFWFSVAAHGLEPERIHILDYGRVQSFEEVEALAFQNRYEFADGTSFGIWRGALDTGGGLDPTNRQDTRPMQAQRWLNGIRPGVVHGTKGMSRNQPGVFVKISQPDKAGTLHKGRTAAMRSTPLYLLDTDSFKRLAAAGRDRGGADNLPRADRSRLPEADRLGKADSEAERT